MAANRSRPVVAGLALAGLVAGYSAGGDLPTDPTGVASSSHARGTPCPVGRTVASRGRAPRVRHVSRVVVMMENRECGQIVGNPAAPSVNALANRYGLAVNAHSIAHPSSPNYLALTGGSTFGRSSDCRYCVVDATNLVDQLESAGISWKAYMEGVPTAAGGNVATIVAGGAARRGAVSVVPYDHYSVLRTIEDVWRLPKLRDAGCSCTAPMFDLVAPVGAGA